MQQTFPLSLILCLTFPWGLTAQEKNLTTGALPELLARYEDSLRLLERAYEEPAIGSMPREDEFGHVLIRRQIQDRQRALADLSESIRQLRTNPRDLVAAIQLLVHSELIVDDLFDLSRIAYDNDNDELGRRLSDVMRITDRHGGLIESYVQNLAAETRERIRMLEVENEQLRQRLRIGP